jgi:hypothetical protein
LLGAIFARRIWAVEESRMSRVPVELREQVMAIGGIIQKLGS